MPWSTLKTWQVGDLVTAGLMNDQLRDHLNELYQYQNKGDLVVATSSITLARLPVGTNGQTLIADSTLTNGMKWANIQPVFGYAEKTSDQATTSRTYIDATSLTATITLPAPSYVIGLCSGICLVGANPTDANGAQIAIRLVMGATAMIIPALKSSNANPDWGWQPYNTQGFAVAVPAGAYTVKAQFMQSSGYDSKTVTLGSSNLLVMAFPTA